VNPIWSRDGRYIVYTREQAKGTDSNIFIADVATEKSTLLTPHEGEHLYFATDVSPGGMAKDMDYLLITSNAENGYDNIGLLGIGMKGERSGYVVPDKIKWLTATTGKFGAANFRLTASTSPSAPTSMAMKTSFCTILQPASPHPFRLPRV
jgi:hypothetical protein